MPAFKKLGPGDQIDNVLVLEPQWTLASGTDGWHGSPEGSASVNLYGGANRVSPAAGGVIQGYQYSNLIPEAGSYGVLRRPNPITASVNFVYLTKEDLTISERSSTRWGYEHWKTVMGLYDYYSRRNTDYVTSSYDFYAIYFKGGEENAVFVPVRDVLGLSALPTGSFTIESWVKPFSSGSAMNTIQSINRSYWFGITGSNGRLTLSGAFGSITSSVGLPIGSWSHVAYSYDSISQTGTLYVDLTVVGSGTHVPFIRPPSFTASLSIGAVWSGTLSGGSVESAFSTVGRTGDPATAFHGFIGESRLWPSSRTAQQISGTHNVRLTGSILTQLVNCVQFTEGPLVMVSDVHGMGSGVLDQAIYAKQERSGNFIGPHGRLASFDLRPGPTWVPSDNARFYVPKQFVTGSISGSSSWNSSGQAVNRTADVTRMLVLNVPRGMYGREIKRGSVRIVDTAFSGYGLERVIVDDGRGGLYISGSMFSQGFNEGYPQTEYDGVVWNKVGNVFYDEGLIVIRDPALLDVGAPWTTESASPSDLLQLSFRGDSRIPVKTVIARIERGELNRSLNPSYYTTQEDGFRAPRHASSSLYVTTVGLYNSDRELVGVARLAEPLRVRPRDRLAIKIRMDF